ncbi:hypothetical protein [Undibacterium sp. TJN19]|uniref:hypothetical protein n=1 Tax=Undibacterium sp. TJN19 TaxID=3413055 RepID=UPI003BF2AA47
MITEQTMQEQLRSLADLDEHAGWNVMSVQIRKAADRIDELVCQLAEAQKDTTRLDFMFNKDAFIGNITFDGVTPAGFALMTRYEDGYRNLSGNKLACDSPREAIDLAMQEAL